MIHNKELKLFGSFKNVIVIIYFFVFGYFANNKKEELDARISLTETKIQEVRR